MRKEVTSYIILVSVAFIMHFVWEWLHIPLYTGYGDLGSGAVLTLYATLGDVAYTAGAVLLVGLFKGKLSWLPEARVADYAGLTVLGFCIAIFVEYKALAFHKWAYTAAMPLVLGVGLSPLLQMAILLPVSVGITKGAMRRLAVY